MESGIYYILNVFNGKIYIGYAVSILKRWRVHKHLLRNRKHHNRHLQSAWDKDGEDALLFGIIETVEDAAVLLEREQHWINYYESHNDEKGYNLRPLAGSMLGHKHSDATRKKLSASHKGHAPWNKGKKMEGKYKEGFIKTTQSEGYKNSRRRKEDGFRHTEETRRKMSASAAKRRASDETRRKMSKAMTGKKLGEGHRLNCKKAWEIRKLKKDNKKEE